MRRPWSLLHLPALALAIATGVVSRAAPVPETSAADPLPAGIRSVHIERARDGGGILVLVDAVVAAPPASVAQVVADVDDWPDWIPRMTAVRPLGGDDARREFETDVHLPWPLSDVREHLRMTRRVARDDGGEGVRFEWVQVEGDLRRNEGSWTLIPRGAASTEVIYKARFQLRSWVPMFLLRLAQERQAPRVIENLQKRSLLVGAAPPPSLPPPSPAPPA